MKKKILVPICILVAMVCATALIIGAVQNTGDDQVLPERWSDVEKPQLRVDASQNVGCEFADNCEFAGDCGRVGGGCGMSGGGCQSGAGCGANGGGCGMSGGGCPKQSGAGCGSGGGCPR